MAVMPQVKPPLYRHSPQWNVTTEVTMQACMTPASTPASAPNRPATGHSAPAKHSPTTMACVPSVKLAKRAASA